jgi:hypothetical protein
MKIKNVVSICLLVSVLPLGAWAVTSKQLAVEQEKLYEQVESKDQLRPAMALRLADLFFDASTEVEKGMDFGAAQVKQMENYRIKSIKLYELSLTGFNGQFPVPDRSTQLRIQFQLARLYNDHGLTNRADELWDKLANQKFEPRLQRESALKRAEKLELSTSTADVQKAKAYYNVALPTCASKDLCSYIYYRRGWANYRLGDANNGLDDLLKALESSDKASVAEIIKDVLLFLSHTNWTAEKGVALIEKLSTQYERPDLLEKLTDAYFTSDKRAHYNFTIEHLNKKYPRIDRMVSSLEFQYSERDFAKMKALLANIKASEPNAFTNPEKKIEAEKILYRLIVQWDGERGNKPEYKPYFDEGVALYTRLYPAGPNISKIIDGWVAAETDASKKVAQLQAWAVQQGALKSKAQELRLHKLRLAIASKANISAVVVEEAAYLGAQATDVQEKRELLYQQARGLYELKKNDEALALFIQLAKVTKEKPDKTAIFSQNLALDILASQKRFDEVIAQSNSWTKSPAIRALAERDGDLAKEINDMIAISEKSLFEKSSSVAAAPAPTGKKQSAAKLAEAAKSADAASLESLKNFKTFCLADKFLPKSCENAKTLAIQLKDQDSLITILKKQDKKEELTSELEFGGHFVQAAELLEPGLSQPKVAIEDHLRVAMLYEIGGDYKNRDRILRGTIGFVSKSKKPLAEAQEDLFYTNLKEVGLWGPELLSLPWSTNQKMVLVNELELAGRGNAQTQSFLKSSCVDSGAPWHKVKLAELKLNNAKQKSIKFFGKRSQQNFNLRVKALKTLADSTDCYLKGASSEHRFAVISAVARAYGEMAQEIKSSPIPDGLDAETLAQVNQQLEEAAKPFATQSKEWADQAATHLAKIDSKQQASIQQKYATWDFDPPQASPLKITPQQFNWATLLNRMQKNPFDSQALTDLRQHFQTRGQTRLAAYFEGRLGSMNKEEKR